MNRRDLLKLLAVIPITLGAKELYQNIKAKSINTNLNFRGMATGHKIRDYKQSSLPTEITTEKVETLIVGSGISALTAAWKLISSNYKGKITLVLGPEKFGNSADTQINNKLYPTGAHYLPIQNEETKHTKEILKFFNVITKDSDKKLPTYNNEYLVSSPMERVLIDKIWHEGIHDISPDIERFNKEIESYKNKIGKDNKKLFAIPSVLSSEDLIELDSISFKNWLDKNNYIDENLLLYLDYCCKDDYGVGIEQTSAWAGIHYFAGRTGECKNMEKETILTWENGNAFLAKKMFDYVSDKISIIEGSVLNLNKNKSALILQDDGQYKNIIFKNVIVSTPLHVVNYLFKEPIIPKELIPKQSIWIVSNFLFKELPTDIYGGCDLAYDNVIKNSNHLGFIASDNIGLDRSMENKVLTTYFCLPGGDIKETRKKLLTMSKEEYFELASKDLVLAYGEKIFNLIESVEVNIRGHAMSFPEVGFRKRRKELLEKMNKLESFDIYFAHSDISSISIFEEASWWGYKVAEKILNNT